MAEVDNSNHSEWDNIDMQSENVYNFRVYGSRYRKGYIARQSQHWDFSYNVFSLATSTAAIARKYESEAHVSHILFCLLFSRQ